MSNLILQGGRAIDSGRGGGALQINRAAKLENMQFLGNTASDPEHSQNYGGAIYSNGGPVEIYDSVFTQNHASYGGAILHRSGNFYGENLIFENNGATWYGGAIQSEGGQMHLVGVSFSDHSVALGGSAIRTISGSTVIMSNARFTGNRGGEDGGAIYVRGGFLTVNDATFEDDSGRNTVYVRFGGRAVLNRVRFLNNRTGDHGVVYAQSNDSSAIINCLLEFSGNIPDRIGSFVQVTDNNCSSNGESRTESEPDPRIVSPNETIAHNQAVITEQGYKVTLPHGLETIAFKALKPDDCGAIGNQAVCDMDVLQVADISGWAEQGIRFCFKGYGKVLFLPSHDANGVAINQKTAQPEELPVEVDGDHVCVTINRDGKLFLVEGEPLVLQVQTQTVQVVPAVSPTGAGDAPETDCDLPPLLQVGDVAYRRGSAHSQLRGAPFASGDDMDNVNGGDRVTVLEGPTSADNYYWYKVRTEDGKEGWVAESGDYIDDCGYYFRIVSKGLLPDDGWFPSEIGCALTPRLRSGAKVVSARGYDTRLRDSASYGADEVAAFSPHAVFEVVSTTATADEYGFIWIELSTPSSSPSRPYIGWAPEFGGDPDEACIYYLEPYVELGSVPESDLGLLPPIELDPSIERTINLGATSGRACLSEGKETHRFQLPLSLPTNTVSVRMTVEEPNWGNLVPGLTVFTHAGGPRGRDPNISELNSAQLDNLPLERGLYIISAWSVRGSGCYTLQVVAGGLNAVEAQAVPTPLPPAEPLSPQDPDIVAELPRYQQDEESASASTGAQLACGAWLSLGAAGHVDGTARAHLLGTVTSESWTALETVYGMYIKQKLETGENLTDEEVAALVEMDAIPLGVCGALGFAVDELERARRGENRFDHLLEQAGIDTEREDPYARRDTSCELDLNRTVGIYNWPAKDSDPVGKLNAREEMPVFGTVQIPGERPYYIIRVKVSGSRLLPDFAENLRNGTGFVPVEFVDVTGTGCQRLPDWSSVLRESFVVKPTTSNEIRPIVFDLSDHGGEECFVKTRSANALLLCHDMYETRNWNPSCSLTPQGGRFNVEKYTDDGRIYLRMPELSLESGWAPILRGELYDEDSGTFKQGTSLSFVTDSNLDCLPKF